MSKSGSTCNRRAARSGPPTEVVYNKLWHFSAGPLVSVPSVGERVYYFPKGHREQLESSMRHGSEKKLPIIYLPDKILCKVVNVLLQADPGTEEVYSQITLLPDQDQNEVTIPDPALPETSSCIVHSLCHTLSALDISTHQGISLCRTHAVDCLPPLDTSQKPPSQELVACDIHGNEWRFCHTLQGKPERHFLTTGWNEFVGVKKLLPGDAVIFLREGNGDLHVGVRRKMSVSDYMPSSETFGHSHLGILAAASHAIATGTLFSVIYKPRKSQFPFIISLNKYLEAPRFRLSVGMKFKMRFEGEEVPEESVIGTIVGVENTSGAKYEASEWRSIQVRWNQQSSLFWPDSISPWEIEQPKRSWSKFLFGKLKKFLCCDRF